MTRLQQFLFKDVISGGLVLPLGPIFYYAMCVTLICVIWPFFGSLALFLLVLGGIYIAVPLSSLATPQTNPSSHLLIDALSDHYNISAEQQTAAQSNQFCASALSTHGSARLRGTSFGTN